VNQPISQLITDYAAFLNDFWQDLEITEILILNPNEIWCEKGGVFAKAPVCFDSILHHQNFLHQLCDEAGIQFNYEHPHTDGQWKHFRVHICAPPISQDVCLTLRRLRQSSIRLEDLQAKDWCDIKSMEFLKNSVRNKKNIVVVGGTGSGKTTLLNSLVAEAPNDRCVFIEDTPELLCANPFSSKLLTRKDYQGNLRELTQSDLLRQSLRMRPDRLIVGEVRSGEAKDLLMALSTGHAGSMTSLHAGSANEALLRLEMLVQMGASQWSLSAIRRLIQLTVDYIVVTQKQKNSWRLQGVYKISSLEEFGFTVEKVFDENSPQTSTSR
jgi:pilus assembly protein CpaF